MAYSEKVIDHYENPRNVGSFDNSDESLVAAWSVHRRVAT
jgi:nitrogen fixation NifU-like protein